jgi:transketolase
LKGKYFSFDIEDKLNWHGKPITSKSGQVIAHVKSLMKNQDISLTPFKPNIEHKWAEDVMKSHYKFTPNYDQSKQVSTREAYGLSLKKLGEQDGNDHIVALDADVKNSTFAEYYEKAYPNKFINCFIAEQNMISVALGVSKRNKITFCSTFGCFFTRAYDQIRMSAISFANTKFYGSHSGVHIGQDGPSQMGLEDLSMFKTIPNSLVLYPTDAVSTDNAIQLAANYRGIVYIKGGRANHPFLYKNDEEFAIGKSKVLKSSENDILTIVSGGPTLYEALKVYERLASEGVHVRVVDIFCVKPIDKETLTKCAKETGIIYVVEDQYADGGIADSVSAALRLENCKIYQRAVTDVPRSGTPEELYDLFGLSANKQYDEIRNILKENNK